MWPRLGLRTRLQLSVIGAVGLALIGLIAGFNIVVHGRLSHEANSTLVARAGAELASLTVRSGRVVVPEVPDVGALDAQTWVFAGTEALEQPRSDPVTGRAAERLAGAPRGTVD